MKIILRIRHEVESNMATAWLLEQSGPAISCLLYGVVEKDKADSLANLFSSLGIAVEMSECKDKRMDEPRPETVAAVQKSLFEAEEEKGPYKT